MMFVGREKRWLALSLAALVAAGTSSLAEDAASEVPATNPPAASEKATDETTAADPAAEKQADRSVEVVFVLDTTGSMGGLIAAAKEKIWAIANTLATAKPAPTIKMGLVAYRDRSDAYVTKVTDLTDDLDAVYKELMDFQAQGGGDGPESVNQALHEAITKIAWSKDDKTYRVVFLVGDAEPHMDYEDDVKYSQTCETAAKAEIVINSIQCGNNAGATPHWTKIASLAEGSYFKVEQSGGAILTATPFDEDLAKLSTKLGGTRVYYGKAEERKARADKAEEADGAVAAAPVATAARRAEFFAKEAGKKAFGGEKELVDAIRDEKIALDEIAEEELPEPLQKLNPTERKAYIEKQGKLRDEIQAKIAELGKKRQAYIKAELEKQAKSGKKDSLDEAVYKAIKKQAADRGLKYEGGPEF